MNNHFLTGEDNLPQRNLSSRGRNKVGKIYKQFYRKAWEDIPEFKEWLTSIPGERSKAYCKICERSLHAHRLSLTKHTVSLKHMRLAQKKAQQNDENIDDPAEISLEGKDSEEDEGKYILMESVGDMKEELVCETFTGGHEITIPVSGETMSVPVVQECTLEQLRAIQKQEEDEEEEDGSVQEVSVGDQVIYASHDPGSQQIIYQHKDTTSDSLPLLKILQKKKQSDKPHISTHVLDISKGLPVAGLSVSLYQLVDGRWIQICESSTNGDGRCNELSGTNGIKSGRYKLHFDTERYFLLRHQPSFYPFVEVVFDVCSPNDKNHVPLLLGPYGYTTYRGS